MNREETTYYVSVPNARPDYRLVITFLWDDGKNVDTDGNSYNPTSRTWTQLYITNREEIAERVNIFPAQENPLILQVCSKRGYLAARAAYFLAHSTQGAIASSAAGDFSAPDSLRDQIGMDFSIEEALQRTQNSRYANSTLENPYPWINKF